ncbi:2180_t:CDS:2 [Funneliformis mosseae]|uniref:2180_t:CDS:1 n=1 Tax=Funneliformis mosseae TaxID=27381 RepID=A0A9N9E5Z1_FUNMO|nr:2180_t:CDS:2 [Funneliformis mosseae]
MSYSIRKNKENSPVKIINRLSQYPQSQGLVKCANRILQQKLGKSKLRDNCTLVDNLFENSIHDEENIPDTIQIFDNYIENLDNDILFEQDFHHRVIDPILLDIINEITIPDTITGHEILRRTARQVGSKFGIIEVCYSAGGLEPLGTTFFPELENIPSKKISIREALRLQALDQYQGVYVTVKVIVIITNVVAKNWMKNVEVDVIADVHVKTKIRIEK